MVLMDILCSARNSLHDHLPLSTDTDKSLFVYLKIEKKTVKMGIKLLAINTEIGILVALGCRLPVPGTWE